MIYQNYPVTAQFTTLIVPTYARTTETLTIRLENGLSVKVVHDKETGRVTFWDPKKKSFEFFRSLREATEELNLQSLGLQKVSMAMSYRGATVTLFGSVFSQAPQEVKDEYRDEKNYLKSDREFIWYFAYSGTYGTHYYSHELKDACIYIFKAAVDMEIDPPQGQF